MSEDMIYPKEEADEYRKRFSLLNSTIGFKMTFSFDGNTETVEGKLYPRKAPLTVKNFVELAKSGFYNGMPVHRYIRNTLIQTGDPTGTGKGGSDKEIYGEFYQNGIRENNLAHLEGALGMARYDADPNSARSQFYIMFKPDFIFNGNYAVFGYVTKNIKALNKINRLIPSTKDLKPSKSIILEKVEILDKD